LGETLNLYFPQAITSHIKLFTSLCSGENVQAILENLYGQKSASLSSFTGELPPVNFLASSFDFQSLTVNQSLQVFSSQSFYYQKEGVLIPQGSSGIVTRINDGPCDIVVTWTVEYSKWQILLCHLHRIIVDISTKSPYAVNKQAIQEATGILELFVALVKDDVKELVTTKHKIHQLGAHWSRLHVKHWCESNGFPELTHRLAHHNVTMSQLLR